MSLINSFTMTLSNLFLEARVDATNSASSVQVKKLEGNFLVLHDKFHQKLKDFHERNEVIKEEIRKKKIDNFEVVYKDFYDEYDKLLKSVNEGCLMELANSSAGFMKKIEAANGEFLEDIIKLAQVWGNESNVDFQSLERMYNMFRDLYLGGSVHYRSCSELKRIHGDDEAVYQRELEFHLKAADAYGIVYVTDESDPGYKHLTKSVFTQINNANSQNAARAREHLYSFAVGALTSKEVWTLVKKRQDEALGVSGSSSDVVSSLNIAGSVIVGDKTDNPGNSSKVLSEDRLKQLIQENAFKTAKFLSRLTKEAKQAFGEDDGLTFDERKQKAILVELQIQLPKVNLNRLRLGHPVLTLEEYVVFVEEEKEKEKEVKRNRRVGIKSAENAAASSTVTKSSRSSRYHRAPSKKKELTADDSEDESEIEQQYDKEELQSISVQISSLKVGEKTLVPHINMVGRVMKNILDGACVVNDKGCLRTKATRDYFVGEIIVQVAVISKLAPGEKCATFGACSLADDVWLENAGFFTKEMERFPDCGVFHPEYPLMYTQCPFLETDVQYCNLLQLDDSTLKVIYDIKAGEFMMSYGESQVKELAKDAAKAKSVYEETVSRVMANQLKFFVGLVMDLEREVLEKILVRLLNDGEGTFKDKFAGTIEGMLVQQMKIGAFCKHLVGSFTNWSEFDTWIEDRLSELEDDERETPQDMKNLYLTMKDFRDTFASKELQLQWDTKKYAGMVFDLNDVSVVQRYMSFSSIRCLVYDSRFGFSGEPITLEFREDLVDRMVEFMLFDRFCVLPCPSYFVKNPYPREEYEFVEPLPKTFYSDEESVSKFPPPVSNKRPAAASRGNRKKPKTTEADQDNVTSSDESVMKDVPVVVNVKTSRGKNSSKTVRSKTGSVEEGQEMAKTDGVEEGQAKEARGKKGKKSKEAVKDNSSSSVNSATITSSIADK